MPKDAPQNAEEPQQQVEDQEEEEAMEVENSDDPSYEPSSNGEDDDDESMEDDAASDDDGPEEEEEDEDEDEDDDEEYAWVEMTEHYADMKKSLKEMRMGQKATPASFAEWVNHNSNGRRELSVVNYDNGRFAYFQVLE